MHSSAPVTPKYWHIAQTLRDEMSRGVLRPGDRVPSRSEMQDRFGISRATVDKVHSLLEQDGLIVKEQGRGTFVSELKRQQKTHIIGCAGLANFYQNLSYYLRLMQGIQQTLQREGYELLILNANSTSIAWEKIDAVLSCAAPNDLDDLPIGMRCVSMIIPALEFPSVVADDYRGVRLAVEHLLRLGHRRIGYLMQHDSLTNDRLRGYYDAMHLAGIEPDPRWVRRMTHHHEAEEFKGRGRESMRLWLEDDWNELGLTGLLAQNDRTAMGALETLQNAGIRVPHDLSLVGFDSTDECEMTSPRLTSVAVPLVEIGTTGAQLLLKALSGQEPEQDKIVIDTRLEIRESTAPPRS